MTPAEYPAWLCLKTAPELNLKACLGILEDFPDPAAFVGEPEHPIYRSGLLKHSTAEHLKAAVLPVNFPQIAQLMKRYDISCFSITEPSYPPALKEIFAPPLLLYVRGDLATALDATCLAVVGTRKTSAYGREICKKILGPVCERGVTILSGLAMGIDTIAHHTALQKGTRTIAVLASGLETIYPSTNLELAERIIANGALISEYEPGTKVERWNFPARNRIISALSQAVLIVEGPITSGALLTAKNAIEQNREVFAIPGNINNINAEGPNHLIKHGAALIANSDDLLANLGLDVESSAQMVIMPELCEDEQKLYDLLKSEQRAMSFDELLISTGFPIGRLATHLTNLELKGLVEKESGNSFFAM